MNESTSWCADPPPPVQNLIEALQVHRLMFLYWATAVRPRSDSGSSGGAEYVFLDDTRGWSQMLDDMDAEGEFLIRHERVLNRYAERATRAFGPGRQRARHDPEVTAKFPEPHWILNPGGAPEYLEPSSEHVQASLYIARPQLHAELGVRVANVVRPGRCNRWTEAVRVPWEYLTEVEEALAEIWKHLFFMDWECDIARRSNAKQPVRKSHQAIHVRVTGERMPREEADTIEEALRDHAEAPGESSRNSSAQPRHGTSERRESLSTGGNEPPAVRGFSDPQYPSVPRRTLGDPGNTTAVEGGPAIEVDACSFQLRLNGKSYQFSNTRPFALLDRLAQRPGSAVSVATLIQDIWVKDGTYGEKATVHKTADRLRKALKEKGIDELEIDGTTYVGLYVLRVSEKCQR